MLDLPTMLNLVSTYKFLATEASSSVYVFYCGPFARRLLLGGLSSHEVFQASKLSNYLESTLIYRIRCE
jgi:hypothetical protein